LQYRMGQMEGECIDYDRSGAVVQKSYYKNNLLEGPSRRYWPSGEVMEEVVYRAGKPVGKARQFDSNGKELSSDAQASWWRRLEQWVKG
jgi:antitoxin component YwqK of YwqJK toxin-antitoxin module